MARSSLPKKPIGLLVGLVSLFFVSTQAYADVVERCWKQEKSHGLAVECEAAEAKKVEAALDAQMAKQLKETKAAEKEAKNAGTIEYEGLSGKLADSQKAFDIYKRMQCDYEVATYGSGTFGADAAYACEINLMNERLVRLKKFYFEEK